MLYTKISLPDVPLLREFGPTFLNDVVHHIRLRNSFLRLSVLLKRLYLSAQNDLHAYNPPLLNGLKSTAICTAHTNKVETKTQCYLLKV